MLRPIRRCHTNIDLTTYIKIHTDIHPNLQPPTSYSLSFTLQPIFCVLTFQINSLLLWSVGGLSCPALLLCWLLDIVSNTLLVLILLWTTLLLVPQPVGAVTQIIMWSRVCFNWFECLVDVSMRILGKSCAVVYQWGMIAALVNLSIPPNLIQPPCVDRGSLPSLEIHMCTFLILTPM